MLGLITFLTFINDLFSGSFRGIITEFADDTAFNCSDSGIHELVVNKKPA